MSDSSSAAPAPAPSTRSRLALVLLLVILALFGYGFYERNRLIAAQQREQDAIKTIAEIQGNVIEADEQDWRWIFVPDQPDTAKRIGIVYVPHKGPGPGYTEKVAGVLGAFENCTEVFLAAVPGERKGRSMGGPPPAASKEEAPKKDLESLDLEALKSQFPKIKFNPGAQAGSEEETQSKPDAAKEEKTEAEKPGKEDPASEKPAEKEPAKEEPAQEEPTADPPANEEPKPDAPAGDEPPSPAIQVFPSVAW